MNQSSSPEEDFILIDFGTDSNEPTAPKDRPKETRCEAEAKSEPKEEPKLRKSSRLSGYLNKYSSRGILRTFRKRWFVFSPENCKLYYYRSQQDQIPIGEIDISRATFTFDVSNEEKRGLFTISIPGKEYALEASSRQACLYWLQELQRYRRANSLMRTTQIRERSESGLNRDRRPRSGLLAKLSSDNDDSKFSADDIFNISSDVDFSKEEELSSSGPISVAQMKISHLRNQVLNSVAAKFDMVSSQFGGDNAQYNRFSGQPSSFFYDTDSPPKDNSQPLPAESTKFQKLSELKTKLTESFKIPRSNEEQNMSSRRLSKKISCTKCLEHGEKIETLLDEVSSLQDELSASRCVIQTLQTQLDIALKEKESMLYLNEVRDWTGCLEMLNNKDQKIAQLTQDIQSKCQEVESIQRHDVSLQKEVAELREKTSLFEELLQQKDKTIISLTNEVFDLETEKRDQESKSKDDCTTFALEKLPEGSDSIEKLEDAVQAFELQNKFLNKEILELNQLRDDADQRELVLTMKCSEWEARCCQVQSKLLFLLKEFKKDKDGIHQDAIARLLEEALPDEASPANIPKWSIENQYDDLGFNWKWGKEDLLSTKATNLRQRFEDITNKTKQDSDVPSWSTKWNNFVATLGNRELQRSPELKMLIRQGIPPDYRGRIWKGCIDMKVRYQKIPLTTEYYQNLLNSKEFSSRVDPSSKQIQLDLLRTLPNNRHYENLDSDGVPKLRRVLLAYSRHDPVVGYCQGLNRLAAIALLFMEEVDAFRCLVAIIQYLMPDGYYSRTLDASQVDQRVLKDLLMDKLPRLHAHLEQFNIDLSLFTFNWFLTVFVDNIPVDTYLRIWDVFLYEGSKVLFRYSLAFFKYCENEILQLKEYVAISKYLRNIAENMTDVRKLHHIAFNELNPFPQKVINAKRAQHMQIVKAQIEEMEILRKSLPTNVEREPNMDCPSEED